MSDAPDPAAPDPAAPDPAAGSGSVRRRMVVTYTARVLLLAVLIGGPLLAGLLALDLFSVRGALLDARRGLDEVRTALADAQLEQADEALAEARVEIDDAARRVERRRWDLAVRAPVVGPSFRTTREVVDVAEVAVGLAATATSEGREVLDAGLRVEVVDGRVDLTPLFEIQQLVAELPIDELQAARDTLARPSQRWVPDELRDGREDVLELADQVLATVTTARELTDVLPGFLGTEQPRRYFVGFQTSAELRGTGGLIGFWGVMGVDDGQITFGGGETHDPFDDVGAPEGETRTQRINTIGLSFQVPEAADHEYLRRYYRHAGANSFPNINLDPDLPTTAKAVLDLFEQQVGYRPDGVILLDPIALEGMLRATGDTLPIDDELAELLGLDGELRTEDFAELVTSDIYDTLGFERSDERNDALRLLGDTAFLRIFDGGWSGPEMVRAVASASTQRHLQISSEDPDEQAAFTAVGVAGNLDPSDRSDVLAVIANNIVGGKQDVHLGHGFDVEVALGAPQHTGTRYRAVRDLDLTIEVDNPLPSAGLDDYIIGNCFLVGEPNRCFEGPPGWNWTWFSIWSGPETRLTAWELADADASIAADERPFRGFRVIDQLHPTPSQQRSASTVELSGFTPLQVTDGGLVYELVWWRQSKAIPDLLDLRVAAPDGWRIRAATVTGGGDGRGLGVHGEGVDLEVEVDDDLARLHGTVTAHTYLRVELVEDGAGGDPVEARR